MSTIETALPLARGGLPVFPCRANKAPACPHGFKDAVTEPGAVTELFTAYPGALIGVPTGVASGFFVVDVDSARYATAAAWYEENASRLLTRSHRTRSGGLHLVYKHAGHRGTASKLARGVDTRGEGSLVIWWPAHVAQDEAAEKPVADLPQWLISALAPPRATRPRSSWNGGDITLRGVIRTVAHAPQGQRNALLFWGTCRVGEAVRERVLDTGLAIDLMLRAAAHAGLQHAEALRTIDSALKTTGVSS
jgi:hypothetical protein